MYAKITQKMLYYIEQNDEVKLLCELIRDGNLYGRGVRGAFCCDLSCARCPLFGSPVECSMINFSTLDSLVKEKYIEEFI